MKVLKINDKSFRALYHVCEFTAEQLNNPNEVRAVLQDYTNQLKVFLKTKEATTDLVAQFAKMPDKLSTKQLVNSVLHYRNIYKQRLDSLDVGIINTCNLSCRACAAAAPLSTAQHACTADQLYATLHRFAELSGPNRLPGTVNLLGGEPTIHPQFLDVVRAARNAMSSVQLRIISNGVHLANAPDHLFKTLAKLNVDINVSIYGPGSFFFITQFTQGAPTLTCDECVNHTPLLLDGYNIIEVCPAALMPNGDLCFCGNVPMAQAVANHFNIPLKIERGLTGDVVNIFDVDDFEELLKFMQRPTTPMAKYCGRPKVIPWGCSSKAADEWLDKTWKIGVVEEC